MSTMVGQETSRETQEYTTQESQSIPPRGIHLLVSNISNKQVCNILEKMNAEKTGFKNGFTVSVSFPDFQRLAEIGSNCEVSRLALHKSTIYIWKILHQIKDESLLCTNDFSFCTGAVTSHFPRMACPT